MVLRLITAVVVSPDVSPFCAVVIPPGTRGRPFGETRTPSVGGPGRPGSLTETLVPSFQPPSTCPTLGPGVGLPPVSQTTTSLLIAEPPPTFLSQVVAVSQGAPVAGPRQA